MGIFQTAVSAQKDVQALGTGINNYAVRLALERDGRRKRDARCSCDVTVDKSNEHGLRIISRGTAVVFLLIYCAYIYFQVRLLVLCSSFPKTHQCRYQLQSHAYLFDSKGEEECHCNCPCGKAGLAASHVNGSLSSGSSGLVHDPTCATVTHAVPAPGPAVLAVGAQEEEEEVPKMSVVAAATALLLVTLTTSFCADYRELLVYHDVALD